MGLKDHATENRAGLIHDLGLDLEYLHVEGADRQTGCAETGPPAMEEEPGESPGAPGPPAAPEGPDDGELDLGAAESRAVGRPHEPSDGVSVHTKNAHQPLCRAQCVDLGTEGPPEPPSEPSSEHETADATAPPPAPAPEPAQQPSPVETPKVEPDPRAADEQSRSGGKEYQAKLEFSLKLGYPEETVRLVLSKLGPGTLINDILGELVKLGSKSEAEQPQTAAAASASSSLSSTSSSSYGCCDSLEGQRSDSPCQAEALGDHDNLRPIVVDGSNVAMR